ncbi:hypothetical protein [Zavarzinia aquatilis]|uniref:Alpha/beta hydrolase n=1 Tax=Zavarzinia aquatilis TaxID=2211142 RepID=A0A317E292_9PROT|nr:hypothetical protein [Zavarzinia aquatilis]PWR19265.1 hypothetical protein DKG74_17445 [Zavarzinia aquatilis]
MSNDLRTLNLVARRRRRATQADSTGFPLLDGLLEPLRKRNAYFDTKYYNVENLTAAEVETLAPRLAKEGMILLVPPSGTAPVRHFPDVDAFVAAGGADVRAVTVSGVGSSALGSAALARDVADAVGAPVAAVVAGYGASDVVTEGLGGYFLFGAANRLRYLLDLWGIKMPVVPPDTADGSSHTDFLAHWNPDVAALAALLADARLSFTLLVGHSKGNLVISEALNSLQVHHPEALHKLEHQANIVTLSAIVEMPGKIWTYDVIGMADALGALNSVPGIMPDLVLPFVTHTTSPDKGIYHLPVTKVIRDFLARVKDGSWPPRPATS